MKNFILSLSAVVALSLAAGCSDSDDNGPIIDEPGSDVVKSGILTENETWTADNIYILQGKVVVDDGVTLTIEPGTIIKGDKGQESEASALVVDQGGKLMANGTPDAPIIFTSIDDNIQQGQKAGTNLDINANGLWGGVIILGKAPISVDGDAETWLIEGIPANEPYGQYGGTDAADNSGTLRYVSIRHGGVTIGQDNEINGLTLGGVGSGTIIENIEIIANQDDGIEWFGGTVNAKNLLTWGHGDDGLDVDQEYSGTISNALVIQGDEPGSAFELDGAEGTNHGKAFTMKDITILGNGHDALLVDLREAPVVNFENILAVDLGTTTTGFNINDADAAAELLAGNITFSNIEVLLPGSMDLSDLAVGFPAEGVADLTDNVTVVGSVEDATVGADLSVFSWTLAASEGAF